MLVSFYSQEAQNGNGVDLAEMRIWAASSGLLYMDQHSRNGSFCCASQKQRPGRSSTDSQYLTQEPPLPVCQLAEEMSPSN